MNKFSYNKSNISTHHERSQYRKSAERWLSRFNFQIFTTLTFDRDVSADHARKQLEYFNLILSQKTFGDKATKKGQRVSFAAFLEEQPSGRLHWHLLIAPATTLKCFRGLTEADIEECWGRCRRHGKQVDVSRIFDREGVVNYVTKEMKYDADTLYVDWLRPNNK